MKNKITKIVKNIFNKEKDETVKTESLHDGIIRVMRERNRFEEKRNPIQVRI